MKKPLDDEARLRHILQAIDYVEEFMEGKTKNDLYTEPMLRFAVERQLEIIGEAANRLSDQLKAGYPETEWRKIVAFRNFVVHEYFGIDLNLVWDIVQTKIKPLRAAILTILGEE